MLRGGSTSSLSHFRELYGAASVAPMWFSIVLSLLLRRGSTPSLSHFREPYGTASVAPMWFSIVLSRLLLVQTSIFTQLCVKCEVGQTRGDIWEENINLWFLKKCWAVCINKKRCEIAIFNTIDIINGEYTSVCQITVITFIFIPIFLDYFQTIGKGISRLSSSS